MRATFADFIRQNPNCKKFESDGVMRNVFDFLSQDFVIIQMIDMSEAGKPALAPAAVNVEHFFMDISKTYKNTLDDNFTKQAVGLMVKTILEPFGYAAWKQKNLPKSVNAAKFQTASVYRRDMARTATMRVVKYIEEVARPERTDGHV
ncbi:MAG: hypothetical protein LBE31_05895 [Deltaproteobacteria bacterium]|nr:hypothetical protein [Deltaproteobacteria bacterium]